MNDKSREIMRRLLAAGATRGLFIGGCVRDHLMGVAIKDVDIEVYGLDYSQIVDALAGFDVNLVGRAFGVANVDNEIDVSIPRRENTIGKGHRAFDVMPDPTMTPDEAARRRDFTVNSMGMDIDGAIYDPFNGQRDIQAKCLRATSEKFVEDPLRVLRGMQFAARFDFDVCDTDATIPMCRQMAQDFDSLSIERVWGEWQKWASRSVKPGRGLEFLARVGWLGCFPALEQMEMSEQDPEWHPEGNVLVHTGHCCDVAAVIAKREELDDQARVVLLFAVLCHDIAKPACQTLNEEGRIINPQHAQVGVNLSDEFLASIGAPKWITDRVKPLVGEHMAHVGISGEPSHRSVRRLANRLHPANIRAWARVCESDYSGRPPLPGGNPIGPWLDVAEAISVEDNKPKPLLLGRHRLDQGFEPGPIIGTITRAVYEAQLDGEFHDLDGALAWFKAQAHEWNP